MTPEVGKLITGEAFRDAIHVAVAPILSKWEVFPGQEVGFNGDPTAVVKVGIVDPFLPGKVSSGDRYWLFLFPNTVTSLRHQWAHPSFQSEEIVVPVAASPSKEKSEQWLRDFCAAADCPGYDDVIAAVQGINLNEGGDDYGYPGYNRIENDGEYLFFGGRDAHGEIPPEFWDHVEVVTGKKMVKRPSYFSCSC